MANIEIEPTPELEPKLNHEALIAGLQELGVDVEIEDWEGEDDNDVLGHVATLALMYGLDVDETFEALGIPVEQPGKRE